MPKVSVVCAWYNRADYLAETLESLLAQDYDSYEIVLVNDGSPDPRVAEILAGYSDPRLRVIHQANTGFVGAIRRAIAESRGEYIAVMGSGDVSLPERLRLQAALLDADTEGRYVGLGCSYRNVTLSPENEVVDTRLHKRGVIDMDHAYVARNLGSPFTHGEVMYRRSAYDAVGGYRPFFRFSQDLDLWLRMSMLGKFTLVPEILYERRVFQADGVGGDLRKYVVQGGFAHMAQDCARDRLAWGYDLVDVFGDQAGLMRHPDAFMSKFLAKTAIKYLNAGQIQEARFFSTLACRGKTTPLARAVRGMVRAHDAPRLRPLVRRIVSRIPISDKRQANPIPVLREAAERSAK